MARVIVVIGLPGSGKTTLSQQYSEYIIHDDCVSHWFTGQVLRDIKANHKVLLTDPRFCNITLFTQYISQVERYVSRQEIKLILFENNPLQCETNVQERDTRKVLDAIQYYTKCYRLENYLSWNYKVMPVYRG